MCLARDEQHQKMAPHCSLRGRVRVLPVLPQEPVEKLSLPPALSNIVLRAGDSYLKVTSVTEASFFQLND